MTVEQIAELCHTANKVLCEQNNDYSQVQWQMADQWQKDSAIKGVEFKLANPTATPEDQHNTWMKDKIDQGWVYDAVKNIELKTHNCILPYDQLPENQRVKDHIFTGIVNSLSKFVK